MKITNETKKSIISCKYSGIWTGARSRVCMYVCACFVHNGIEASPFLATAAHWKIIRFLCSTVHLPADDDDVGGGDEMMRLARVHHCTAWSNIQFCIWTNYEVRTNNAAIAFSVNNSNTHSKMYSMRAKRNATEMSSSFRADVVVVVISTQQQLNSYVLH